MLNSIRQFFRKYIAKLARLLDSWSGGKLTPDTVTWTGVAAHLPIALFIAFDQLIIAGVFLIIFGLFDVLDGELARLQKTASPRGMVLDASTDRIKEVLIYSAVAYNISQTAYSAWAFLAVIACGTTLTISYIKAKGEVAYAINHNSSDHHKINRMFSEGLVPFEGRIAIIIAGILTGQLLIATGIVAILGIISVFERIPFILKRL